MKTLIKSVCAVALFSIAAVSPRIAQAELCGSLVVVNQTNECVEIFLNGAKIGVVHEGETTTFEVDDHQHATTVQAFCEDDHDLVGRLHFHGFRDAVRLVLR